MEPTAVRPPSPTVQELREKIKRMGSISVFVVPSKCPKVSAVCSARSSRRGCVNAPKAVKSSPAPVTHSSDDEVPVVAEIISIKDTEGGDSPKKATGKHPNPKSATESKQGPSAVNGLGDGKVTTSPEPPTMSEEVNLHLSSERAEGESSQEKDTDSVQVTFSKQAKREPGPERLPEPAQVRAEDTLQATNRTADNHQFSGGGEKRDKAANRRPRYNLRESRHRPLRFCPVDQNSTSQRVRACKPRENTTLGITFPTLDPCTESNLRGVFCSLARLHGCSVTINGKPVFNLGNSVPSVVHCHQRIAQVPRSAAGGSPQNLQAHQSPQNFQAHPPSTRIFSCTSNQRPPRRTGNENCHLRSSLPYSRNNLRELEAVLQARGIQLWRPPNRLEDTLPLYPQVILSSPPATQESSQNENSQED